VRAFTAGVTACGFREAAGRVVEFDFTIQPIADIDVSIREIVLSEDFKAAVDGWDRENSWLVRITSGFDHLRFEGWEPQTLVSVDIQQHRLTLRDPEGTEVVVDVSVPYHGADSELNTVRAEGSAKLPGELSEKIADVVHYFDMQSVDLLEIAL
jgi:hypothetical protein